eukprot:scaffold74522_cov73-Cyclotella_meneghiniana.AAC.2
MKLYNHTAAFLFAAAFQLAHQTLADAPRRKASAAPDAYLSLKDKNLQGLVNKNSTLSHSHNKPRGKAILNLDQESDICGIGDVSTFDMYLIICLGRLTYWVTFTIIQTMTNRATWHKHMRSRQLVSTVINGTVITSTLHLTSDDSPVLVSGTLDIASGGSLVVSAGTTLIFETPSSGINVNAGGQLLITGTLGNKVILKAHDDEESWNGIDFGVGSVPAVFINGTYSSGSTIQYADIVRAGYSSSVVSTVGLSLEQGVVPYLLGVDMIDCGGYDYGRAISIQNLQSLAVIRNLRILKSNETQTYYPGYPISVHGNGANAGQLIVENVVVEARSLHDSLYIRSIDDVSVLHSVFKNRLTLSSIGKATVNENSIAGKLRLYSVGVVNVTDNSMDGYVLSFAKAINLVGNSMENGELIDDIQWLGRSN